MTYKKKIKKVTKVPFGIAGMSIGMSIAGKAFNSPGLMKGAAASSKFIAPAVHISVGGELIKQIKKIGKKS